MSGRVFLDTNVLVYLFDRDADRRRERARELLRRESEESTLVLSTQVLVEFFVAVTRKLARPLSHAEGARVVSELAELEVVMPDVPMVQRAIDLSSQASVSVWDALIVRAAIESGCDRLLTEDLQDGWQVEGVTVENPF